MAREIEIKLKLRDAPGLRERLCAAGGERKRFDFERNRILDTKGGTLVSGNRALRIRETMDENGKPKVAILTYKGPREPGRAKIREEIETAIAEPERLATILRHLGFVEKVRYEKRRETWRWDELEVTVDEMPELGWFVEIEGASEAAVFAAREALGLDAAELVAESYITLTVLHGVEDSEGVRVLAF